MKPELKNTTGQPEPQPLLIVISGPSGVGKDSVVERMEERNLPFHFVVTATTRAPRKDEVHGVDYFFFSEDEFAEMIKNNELLEYAYVYDCYKGIPRSQVKEALASGMDVIMRVDVQGAATIRELCPEAVMVFLVADSIEELVNRLKTRKSEKPEDLKKRIDAAPQELERVVEFDYVVPNRDSKLDAAVDMIEAIINAEHHRVNHRKVTL